MKWWHHLSWSHESISKDFTNYSTRMKIPTVLVKLQQICIQHTCAVCRNDHVWILCKTNSLLWFLGDEIPFFCPSLMPLCSSTHGEGWKLKECLQLVSFFLSSFWFLWSNTSLNLALFTWIHCMLTWVLNEAYTKVRNMVTPPPKCLQLYK